MFDRALARYRNKRNRRKSSNSASEGNGAGIENAETTNSQEAADSQDNPHHGAYPTERGSLHSHSTSPDSARKRDDKKHSTPLAPNGHSRSPVREQPVKGKLSPGERQPTHGRRRSSRSGGGISSTRPDLNKPLPTPQAEARELVKEFLQRPQESTEEAVQQVDWEPSTCGFEDGIKPVTAWYNGLPRVYYFKHEIEFDEYRKFLSAISKVPQDKMILQYHDASVYRADLNNLQEDEWLSDNNLCFAYEYLEHTTLRQFNKSRPEMIQLFKPSIAYLLLHAPDIESVRSALPPAQKARFLFLPLNDNPDVESSEGGTHWSLMVVSVYDRRALYYDSLYLGFITTAAKQMASQLSTLLGFPLTVDAVNTPQQMNGSDCGIIVAELTALLLNRLVSTDGHTPVSLSLDDVVLSASAGRSFILTKILKLSAVYMRRNKI